MSYVTKSHLSDFTEKLLENDKNVKFKMGLMEVNIQNGKR